ncbi:MAG: SCP2 sterol-binding domain-containing protein [Proteobacteria bacterium]|nr:SCP2 sterol-binding domain-containing protein [Pseudomonadota bacterium]
MLPSIIKPLFLPLRLVPAVLHNEIATLLSNHFIRGQSIVERLHELNGKNLRLHVTDLDMDLFFFFSGGKLKRGGNRHWDVSIAGTLEDFILLATRKEDPDTLFFNRRLCIEGDTETGLYLKNLLDAMEFDWQAHVTDVIGQPVPKTVVQTLEGLHKRVRTVRNTIKEKSETIKAGHTQPVS